MRADTEFNQFGDSLEVNHEVTKARRWSDLQGMVLDWISIICWLGRCGGQVLQWVCLWLTGMYVFNSMVGLIGDRAGQGTRVDLSIDMSQHQLMRVQVDVKVGAWGHLTFRRGTAKK